MTVRLAMNYTEVEASNIYEAIENPRVAVEQKVDGTRALVVIERVRPYSPVVVRFLGRNGGLLKHTAAMQHFERITSDLLTFLPDKPLEYVLDGEIMIDTGQFVIFDFPFGQLDGYNAVTPRTPYWERSEALRATFHRQTETVRLVASATTANSKQALWEDLQRTGGEGVMVKDLDSPYEPGIRAKHSRKIKFVKTADVVVTGSTRGRNEAGRETGAFSFAVPTTSGNMFNLGSCSAIGKPEVKVGDVIEVAYLYMGQGGGLVQPRMIRVREDKSPEECTLDQFPTYSKAVL